MNRPMSKQLYPRDGTLPLAVTAFSVGHDSMGVIELTGDHGPSILITETQVQALVEVLTDWLYEQKTRRTAEFLREHLGAKE